MLVSSPAHPSVGQLTADKTKKWFLPLTHRLGSWGSCYRSNHGLRKKDVYEHRKTFRHTRTHVIIYNHLSFLSRGHLLCNTHSHLQKGRNKTQDNRFKSHTDNRSHYFKRGFSTAQGDREMHEHRQGTVTLRLCGLWHSVGSYHYMVAWGRTLSERFLRILKGQLTPKSTYVSSYL